MANLRDPVKTDTHLNLIDTLLSGRSKIHSPFDLGLDFLCEISSSSELMGTRLGDFVFQKNWLV